MLNNTARVAQLFRLTGLGDEPRNHQNGMLTWVDRAHFRHVLLSVPPDTLDMPFSGMQEDLPHLFLLSAADPASGVERELCPLVDRLVSEVDAAFKRARFKLPYDDLDWLWRRIAFATMTYAGMEHTPVVMLNIMLLKVAGLIEAPRGLKLLEEFVLEHGYVYQPGEPRAA